MTDEKQSDFRLQLAERIKSDYRLALKELENAADSWSLRRPVLALSGGPDSTTLLMVLDSFASEFGVKLRPCHINHRLRGAESDTDQEFCRNLSKSLGYELEVRDILIESHSPSEDKLRKLRYGALMDFAREIDSSLILTGHTSDDQVETMLFRLFRGTSTTGLVGISAVRELEPDSKIWVVRPMLNISKVDCFKYLAESEKTARQDSSNLESKYDRNYIRHQIIPKIEERFGQWKKSFLRLNDVVSLEEDYLRKKTDESVVEASVSSTSEEMIFSVEKLNGMHKALARRVIALALRDFNNEPNFERVGFVLDLLDENRSGACVTLSPELEARINEGHLIIHKVKEDFIDERKAFLANQSTQINLPTFSQEEMRSSSNIISWLNKSLKVSIYDRQSDGEISFPAQRALQAYVDLNRVNPPLVVRMRQAGDRIQPFGMQEQVVLKKYLTKVKIQAPFRTFRESFPP